MSSSISNTVGNATCSINDLMTKQQPSIKIPIVTTSTSFSSPSISVVITKASTSMTTSAGTGNPS
jgi:hypothetical protein